MSNRKRSLDLDDFLDEQELSRHNANNAAAFFDARIDGSEEVNPEHVSTWASPSFMKTPYKSEEDEIE